MSGAPLVVHAAGDDLVDACSVGDAVEIVGYLSQQAAPVGAGGTHHQAGGAMQLEAAGITVVAPHTLWALPGARPAEALEAAAGAAGGLLAALVQLSGLALGYEPDPLVSTALLASAAAAAMGAADRGRQVERGAQMRSGQHHWSGKRQVSKGRTIQLGLRLKRLDCGSRVCAGWGLPMGAAACMVGHCRRQRRATGPPPETPPSTDLPACRLSQINLMVCHDDGAPQTLRLLQAAADLMSPQVGAATRIFRCNLQIRAVSQPPGCRRKSCSARPPYAGPQAAV